MYKVKKVSMLGDVLAKLLKLNNKRNKTPIVLVSIIRFSCEQAVCCVFRGNLHTILFRIMNIFFCILSQLESEHYHLLLSHTLVFHADYFDRKGSMWPSGLC